MFIWPLICKCICTVRLWIFAKALMGSLRWLSKVCNGIHLRAVYAFSNRRWDRVKLLLWDRNGFWLLTKRLEADRFMWPRQQAVLVLTIEQLHWLLEGIDIEAMRRHPWRAYRRVS